MLHFKNILLITKLFLISSLLISKERTDLIIDKGNKNIKFKVEIAKTPKERSKGLMFRRNLLKNKGMLFIFPNEDIISIWMKNTYIPLDVIFISQNKVIVDLKKNMKRFSKKIINSNKKSKYAFEFNAGLIDELGIEIGDKVLFND